MTGYIPLTTLCLMLDVSNKTSKDITDARLSAGCWHVYHKDNGWFNLSEFLKYWSKA